MDVESKINEIEERVKKLEEKLIVKEAKPKEPAKKRDYKGLAGGIRMVIDGGFLNQPKSTEEIFGELKREGYHYPKESVRKLLSVDFMKNKRVLTRAKEGGIWKYVVRK